MHNIHNITVRIIIKAIDFYRLFFGLIFRFKPLPIYYLPCKFYPTCSEYSQMAIRRYGVFRGIWISFTRIMRCNPISKGGYDPME